MAVDKTERVPNLYTSLLHISLRINHPSCLLLMFLPPTAAMGRKRTACGQCAAIKTVCDKDQPCSRCSSTTLPRQACLPNNTQRSPLTVTIGLGLPCDYQRPEPVIHKAKVTCEGLRSRAEHKRSTHGCVSCKTR